MLFHICFFSGARDGGGAGQIGQMTPSQGDKGEYIFPYVRAKY